MPGQNRAIAAKPEPPRDQVTTQRLDLTQMTPVGHVFQHVRTWLRAPMGVTWDEAGKQMQTSENNTAANRNRSGGGGAGTRKTGS